MKTEEDEAFDDLARKQGSWGGGFKAKQAMAADKLQGPAQKPVAWLTNEELTKLMTDSYDQGVKDALESIKEGLDALPKREWAGLTKEERDMFIYVDEKDKQRFRKYGEYIEQLLKEKNNA